MHIAGRRHFLRQTACGLGAAALAELLADDQRATASAPRSQPSGVPNTHLLARAKSVIFIFMAGGPSQFDLFEPKPELRRRHGEPVPASLLEGLNDPLIRGSATVFGSPRTFGEYGDCRMPFSDYLPHMASCADRWCMVRSMHTDVSNHHPAQLLMNCGTVQFGHPSMGSWVVYGLGNDSNDLPGFVVLLSNSGKGVDGGSSLWTNGFLPSNYRGVTFRSQGDPILHLSNPPDVTQAMQRTRLATIGQLNQIHYEQSRDSEILARMSAYELAFRMQMAAPDLVDFSRETSATRRAYGLDQETTRPFGANCLLARRMVERGVRFVQLYHSTWDDHTDLNVNLKTNCAMTDQPVAALIHDLAQRGMLDETLVVWGAEFGRTPMNEVRRGNTPGKEGRDHHPFAFTMLLAGGGTRSGQIVGRTDDFGYHIVEDPIHVHDMQATLLHCLGIDHTRLTYLHQGRQARLTDVGGQLVEKLLA